MAIIDDGDDWTVDDPYPWTVANDVKNHSYGPNLPTRMKNGMISVLNTNGVPYIKSLGVAGIPLGKMAISNQADDYVIPIAELNHLITMTHANAKQFTLPSVGAVHVGNCILFCKLGAGRVTIVRTDADTINGQTSIYNNIADELYSFILLRLIAETSWVMERATNPFSWILA